MASKPEQKGLYGALLGLGVGVVMTLLGLVLPVEHLELPSLDARHRIRGEAPLSDRVAIIAVDNASLDDMGWPISREHYATLVLAAQEYGARAVGFDILFADTGANEEGDQLLAAVAKMAAEKMPVIFPVELGFSARVSKPEQVPKGIEIGGDTSGVYEAPKAVWPLPTLLAASDRVAHYQLDSRPDGVFRRVPLVLRHEGQLIPTLGLALAIETFAHPVSLEMTDGTLRDTGGAFPPVPINEKATATISYRSVRQIESRSLVEVLATYLEAQESSEKSPELRRIFEGRVILVGLTAASLGDHGAVPLSTTSPLVVAHANVVQNVLDGTFIRSLPWGFEALVLVLLCSIVGAMVGRWRRVGGVSATVGAIVVLAAAAQVAFSSSGIHLSLIWPTLSLALTSAAVSIHNHYVRDADERFVREAFGRFVSPALLRQIVHQPELLSVRGDKKVISVLFSDIKGYTALSNRKSTDEVMDILNEYLDAMVHEIFRFDGMVDKIMGDGIMAFFGSPLPDPDHAYKAVMCANAMHDRLAGLKERWLKDSDVDLEIRVGIATGMVFVGNIGSKDHLEYTAIGAAVNLASRLESNGRPGHTTISDETYDALAGRVPCSPLKLELKGFSDAVRAWEVVPTGEAADKEPAVSREAAKTPFPMTTRVDVGGHNGKARITGMMAGLLVVEHDGAASPGDEIALYGKVAYGKSQIPFRLGGEVVELPVAENGAVGMRLSEIVSESRETNEHVFERVVHESTLELGGSEEGTDTIGREICRTQVVLRQ